MLSDKRKPNEKHTLTLSRLQLQNSTTLVRRQIFVSTPRQLHNFQITLSELLIFMFGLYQIFNTTPVNFSFK